MTLDSLLYIFPKALFVVKSSTIFKWIICVPTIIVQRKKQKWHSWSWWTASSRVNIFCQNRTRFGLRVKPGYLTWCQILIWILPPEKKQPNEWGRVYNPGNPTRCRIVTSVKLFTNSTHCEFPKWPQCVVTEGHKNDYKYFPYISRCLHIDCHKVTMWRRCNFVVMSQCYTGSNRNIKKRLLFLNIRNL